VVGGNLISTTPIHPSSAVTKALPVFARVLKLVLSDDIGTFANFFHGISSAEELVNVFLISLVSHPVTQKNSSALSRLTLHLVRFSCSKKRKSSKFISDLSLENPAEWRRQHAQFSEGNVFTLFHAINGQRKEKRE
jgi:hypothetical protein